MEKTVFEKIITSNKETINVIDNAKKAAISNISIIITGPSGSGKTLFANCIHNASPNKKNQLKTIDCLNSEISIDSNILDDENTSIYFDEINALSINNQTKLINILNSLDFKQNNIKLIFSTSKNIKKLINENKFIKELYYKITELELTLLSLREKKEDIPVLIKYFIKIFNSEFNKKVELLSNTAYSQLSNYEWPGNIRELKNTIKTAVFLCNKSTLWLEDIPLKIFSQNTNLSSNTFENTFSLKCAEKNHIINTLKTCKWNKSKTAKLLEISRPRLDRKIAEYKIKKE